ncbi:MAG: hypothetical protein Q9224_005610, partial [Gallowayella concinna]
PAQLVPQAGFRILRGGVWLSAYPLAEKYTWRLLLLTLRNLRDTLEHETSVGYVACNWVLSKASDDESGAETIYARGSMWPDPNPGHQLLSLSGLRSNTTSQSIVSTPYDDFEFDLKYDDPARPLDANAAEGAFGLAFAEESSHELDEAVPRQDHRIEKDDVVLEIQPMDEGYTWGMFYYTIKQVQSILRAKGYLSCSWEISKFEEGKKGKTYGTGILWSTAVDGEANKTGYKKACDSLKNCPLILTHPSETQALHGFGPKICERLEQRMKQHCEENGLPMPKRKGRKRVSDALDEAALDMTPAKKPRKSKKPYVPQLRSGAYALILGLASIDESECVSKQQLIELAQPHCDSSFTVSKDTTSFYTAWNSMKTLVDKDMVKETSRPQRRYALTDDGWDVADKLKRVGKGDMEPPATSGPGEAAIGSRSRTTALSSDDNEIDPSGNKPRLGKLEPLHDTSTIQSCAQGQKLGGGVIDKYGPLPSSKTRKIDKKPAAVISRAADRIGKVNANTEDNARLAARLQAEEDNLLASASDNLDFVQLLSSSPPKAPGLLRRQEPPVPPRIDRPSAKRDSASPPEMSSKPGSSTFVPPFFKSIHIQPRNFTVELVLDNREIRSREDRNYIEKELIIKGIRPT